jgi:hypothetical protein
MGIDRCPSDQRAQMVRRILDVHGVLVSIALDLRRLDDFDHAEDMSYAALHCRAAYNELRLQKDTPTVTDIPGDSTERKLLRESIQWLQTLHAVYRQRGNTNMAAYLKEHLERVEILFPTSANVMLENVNACTCSLDQATGAIIGEPCAACMAQKPKSMRAT